MQLRVLVSWMAKFSSPCDNFEIPNARVRVISSLIALAVANKIDGQRSFMTWQISRKRLSISTITLLVLGLAICSRVLESIQLVEARSAFQIFGNKGSAAELSPLSINFCHRCLSEGESGKVEHQGRSSSEKLLSDMLISVLAEIK